MVYEKEIIEMTTAGFSLGTSAAIVYFLDDNFNIIGSMEKYFERLSTKFRNYRKV